MAAFGRTLGRREYWKPAVLRIAPVREGPVTFQVANPGGAEAVQVGTIPKLEGAREANDRPTGQLFFATEPRLKVSSARSLPPSEAVCVTRVSRVRATNDEWSAESDPGRRAANRVR